MSGGGRQSGSNSAYAYLAMLSRQPCCYASPSDMRTPDDKDKDSSGLPSAATSTLSPPTKDLTTYSLPKDGDKPINSPLSSKDVISSSYISTSLLDKDKDATSISIALPTGIPDKDKDLNLDDDKDKDKDTDKSSSASSSGIGQISTALLTTTPHLSNEDKVNTSENDKLSPRPITINDKSSTLSDNDKTTVTGFISKDIKPSSTLHRNDSSLPTVTQSIPKDITLPLIKASHQSSPHITSSKAEDEPPVIVYSITMPSRSSLSISPTESSSKPEIPALGSGGYSTTRPAHLTSSSLNSVSMLHLTSFPGYQIVSSPAEGSSSLEKESFTNIASTITPVWTPQNLGNGYGGGFIITPSIYVTKLPFPNGPSKELPPGYDSSKPEASFILGNSSVSSVSTDNDFQTLIGTAVSSHIPLPSISANKSKFEETYELSSYNPTTYGISQTGSSINFASEVSKLLSQPSSSSSSSLPSNILSIVPQGGKTTVLVRFNESSASSYTQLSKSTYSNPTTQTGTATVTISADSIQIADKPSGSQSIFPTTIARNGTTKPTSNSGSFSLTGQTSLSVSTISTAFTQESIATISNSLTTESLAESGKSEKSSSGSGRSQSIALSKEVDSTSSIYLDSKSPTVQIFGTKMIASGPGIGLTVILSPSVNPAITAANNPPSSRKSHESPMSGDKLEITTPNSFTSGTETSRAIGSITVGRVPNFVGISSTSAYPSEGTGSNAASGSSLRTLLTSGPTLASTSQSSGLDISATQDSIKGGSGQVSAGSPGISTVVSLKLQSKSMITSGSYANIINESPKSGTSSRSISASSFNKDVMVSSSASLYSTRTTPGDVPITAVTLSDLAPSLGSLSSEGSGYPGVTSAATNTDTAATATSRSDSLSLSQSSGLALSSELQTLRSEDLTILFSEATNPRTGATNTGEGASLAITTGTTSNRGLPYASTRRSELTVSGKYSSLISSIANGGLLLSTTIVSSIQSDLLSRTQTRIVSEPAKTPENTDSNSGVILGLSSIISGIAASVLETSGPLNTEVGDIQAVTSSFHIAKPEVTRLDKPSLTTSIVVNGDFSTTIIKSKGPETSALGQISGIDSAPTAAIPGTPSITIGSSISQSLIPTQADTSVLNTDSFFLTLNGEYSLAGHPGSPTLTILSNGQPLPPSGLTGTASISGSGNDSMSLVLRPTALHAFEGAANYLTRSVTAEFVALLILCFLL